MAYLNRRGQRYVVLSSENDLLKQECNLVESNKTEIGKLFSEITK